MASKTTKRYIEYCKLHRLDINSKDSLERYRIDKLLNDDKISKEKSYQISGKIEKEFKNIAKTKNENSKDNTLKKKESTDIEQFKRDTRRINKGSDKTSKQYKKCFKAVIKKANANGIEGLSVSNLTEEKYYEILNKTFVEEWKSKDISDEQIKGRLANYTKAFHYMKSTLPSNKKEDASREEAIAFLKGGHNRQNYLRDIEPSEYNIKRAMKMLREINNISNKIQTKNNLGSKKAYNDDPSRLKRTARFLLKHTNRESLYTINNKDLHRLADSLVEEGMSPSVQRNTLSCITTLGEDFGFKNAKNFVKDYTKLGAEHRVNAKISNAGTVQEFEKYKKLCYEKGDYFQVLALNLSAVSERIEEVFTNLTIKTLEDALENGYIHIENTKGDYPRNTELFNDFTRGCIQESLDLINKYNIDNYWGKNDDIFKGESIFNPKGKSVDELIQASEDHIRIHRKKFQNEDRMSRAEIRDAMKGMERKDIVVKDAYLTMHGWRGMYAEMAYKHNINKLTEFREKHGEGAIREKMYKFYGKQLQEQIDKWKEKTEKWNKRGRKGKKPKRPRGHKIDPKNLKKEVDTYIHKASLRFSSHNIGHHREDVVKIYICKVLANGQELAVDIETHKTYKVL